MTLLTYNELNDLKRLNKLVDERSNERYILSALKSIRYKNIGKDNLDNLISCLRWKDVNYNNKSKIKMSETSMNWYKGQPYESYMEYFNRWLTDDKAMEIRQKSNDCDIIIPNECNIESIGTLKDTSSIIRLKKDTKEVKEDLKKMGVDVENYSFINMKLFVSYYHHVHSPVFGNIKQMIPIEGNMNFFGNNSLWFIEIETNKKPVYFMLVGESSIQDFNFLVKKGDDIMISDDLGYFNWGSQTILLFDKESYDNDIQIKTKHHYFLGDRLI